MIFKTWERVRNNASKLDELKPDQENDHDHPFRVSDYAQHEDEEIVALLHDEVEDGLMTYDDLYALGCSKDQVEAVRLLTRVPNQTYLDYIRSIIHSPDSVARLLAINVKIYDLFDHLHPVRVSSDKGKRLAPRYLHALYLLISELTND